MEDPRQRRRHTAFFQIENPMATADKSSQMMVTLRKKRRTDIFNTKRMRKSIDLICTDFMPANQHKVKVQSEIPEKFSNAILELEKVSKVTEQNYSKICRYVQIVRLYIDAYDGKVAHLFEPKHFKNLDMFLKVMTSMLTHANDFSDNSCRYTLIICKFA